MKKEEEAIKVLLETGNIEQLKSLDINKTVNCSYEGMNIVGACILANASCEKCLENLKWVGELLSDDEYSVLLKQDILSLDSKKAQSLMSSGVAITKEIEQKYSTRQKILDLVIKYKPYDFFCTVYNYSLKIKNVSFSASEKEKIKTLSLARNLYCSEREIDELLG